MYCPSCGSEERQLSQFCRACGTDLRIVRNSLENPDAITQSAVSAREHIGMAVADTAAKFKGQTIPAIRFAITDRETYRPVRTALVLIDEIRRRHPQEFAWGKSIDRLTGSDKVRLAIDAGRLGPLLDEWDREAATFRESRKPFLLYR